MMIDLPTSLYVISNVSFCCANDVPAKSLRRLILLDSICYVAAMFVKYICVISKYKVSNFPSNTTTVGVEPITTVIRSGRMKWCGHVMRTG